MRRILLFALLALLTTVFVSGCTVGSATDLYRLPETAKDYVNLAARTEEVLELGAEYCAPVKGSNRQSVQLVDLNGDGVDEAVAFFKIADDEKPLRVYIYRLLNGVYTTAMIIEAEGNAFDMIEYAQLDGSGYLELLIGTSINQDTPQVMSIFSINSFEPALIGRSTYSAYTFCDVDTDGIAELITIMFSAQSETGVAYMHEYKSGSVEITQEVRISANIERLYSVRTGNLSDKVPAVFLTSVFKDGGWITDIITVKRNRLSNITLNPALGYSSDTIVRSPIAIEDINSDGIMEVPRPASVSDVTEGSYVGNCYMVTWLSYSSIGRTKQAAVTFHNLSENWYVDMTGKWEEDILISHYNSTYGIRCTTFYRRQDADEPAEFMRIYVLTGDNRYTRVNTTGSYLLKVQDVTVYAAKITDTQGLALEYAKEQLALRFNLTRSEWYTGIIS
ncbi:MAG: hypothetical protein GXX89_06210 [Clostridiales bacterium]|nr:hypothetical protein [Clostridiales bacterium]